MRGFTAGQGSYSAIVLGPDGQYQDDAASSAGLSSRLDRLWLKLLRARADVIITTGATVRTEKLLQPLANFLVASKSGDLTGLRAGSGRLLVASDAKAHASWPSSAEHFGSFPSSVEVVREAKTRWQNLQLEFGLSTLVDLHRSGLVDRFFVTAPSESAVATRFADTQLLFGIETLAVYEVAP